LLLNKEFEFVRPFCIFGLCYYPGDRRMSRFQCFQNIKNNNRFYGLCSCTVFTTDCPPVSAVNLHTNDSIYYMESHVSILFYFYFFFIFGHFQNYIYEIRKMFYAMLEKYQASNLNLLYPCHDMAEILLKLVLNTNQSINQSIMVLIVKQMNCWTGLCRP